MNKTRGSLKLSFDINRNDTKLSLDNIDRQKKDSSHQLAKYYVKYDKYIGKLLNIKIYLKNLLLLFERKIKRISRGTGNRNVYA